MVGRQGRAISPALAKAEQRFRSWRRTRTAGTRIPEPLWTMAVRLAQDHGIHATATALGLDYYSLKKRWEASSDRSDSSPAAFLELPSSVSAERECWIELEDGTGARMRLQLKGYEAADVLAVGRGFWKAE